MATPGQPPLRGVAKSQGKTWEELVSQPTDNTPHQVAISIHDLHREAPDIGPGVTLCTRDGRTNGNAIVIKEVEPEGLALIGGLKTFLESTNQKLWLVETDFGNTMRLSDNEILEIFTLGYQMNYEEWWDQRLETIQKTVENFK